MENLGLQNLSTAQLTKQFGRENLIAAQLIIENKDRLIELTEAVTGQDTALEQALVNTDNFASSQVKAGNAIDSLILTFEDGTGALSQFAQALVESFTDTINQISGLNQEVNSLSDGFQLAEKFTSLFGAGIDKANNPFEKLRILTLEVADATKEDLVEAIKLQTKVLFQSRLATGANSEETENATKRLAELTVAYKNILTPTEETTDAIEGQTEAVEEDVVSIGSLQKKLSELNAELKRATVGSQEFTDLQAEIKIVAEQVAVATGKETEATKKLRKEREEAQKDATKAFEQDAKIFAQRQKENEDALKRDAEAAIKLQAIRATSFDDQQSAIIAQRDLELENLKLTENERVLIKEEANKKIIELNQERLDQEEDDNKEANDKDKERRQENFDSTVSVLNSLAEFAGTLNCQDLILNRLFS